MNDKLLKFETVDQGELILFWYKMYLNTYYSPIDFDFIQKVKKRIDELKHASETCVH
jgi:hypothetical protein